MKKIIIGIVLIGLVSWGAWVVAHNMSAPAPSSSATSTPSEEASVAKTYADPAGRCSFQYPNGFMVSGGASGTLAIVSVPREYLPQTNFNEANMTMRREGPSTDTLCSGEKTTSEAAAGNRYDTTTYRRMFDGDCYLFSLLIHYGNIGNYDPNQGVTEFDEPKLKRAFDAIVGSFRLLANSD